MTCEKGTGRATALPVPFLYPDGMSGQIRCLNLSFLPAAQPAYGSSCQAYRHPQHLYIKYQINSISCLHFNSFFPNGSDFFCYSIL